MRSDAGVPPSGPTRLRLSSATLIRVRTGATITLSSFKPGIHHPRAPSRSRELGVTANARHGLAHARRAGAMRRIARWWISDLDQFRSDCPAWNVDYDVERSWARSTRGRRALAAGDVKLSVVIPARNEAETIEHTLREIADNLESLGDRARDHRRRRRQLGRHGLRRRAHRRAKTLASVACAPTSATASVSRCGPASRFFRRPSRLHRRRQMPGRRPRRARRSPALPDPAPPQVAIDQSARKVAGRGQTPDEGDRPLPRRDQLPHPRLGRA